MSQNIKSFEKESFRLKVSKLIEKKTVEDGEFADIIYAALTQFGIDEDQFRDAFGLTKGAAERWTMQKNMPQPMIRAKILDWIRERI